ncbi:MAG: hypothetical protein ABH827_01940 [bacterium]
MDINVTLFVQIINFWITYFFLSRLLCKPIVAMRDQREKARKALLVSLQQRELSLVKKTEEKESLLQDFRLYLKKQYHVEQSQDIPIRSKLAYKKNEQEIKQLSDQAEKILTNRISHACW